MLGPGVPVTSAESSHWLEGGYFLVQTYETSFGDEPAQTGVNYWYYDSEAKRFRIIFFSNNGPFSEEGNRYQGEVAGNKLTFDGPARFQYELDDEGRIKLNPDGALSRRPGGCATRTASGSPGCATPSRGSRDSDRLRSSSTGSTNSGGSMTVKSTPTIIHRQLGHPISAPPRI